MTATSAVPNEPRILVRAPNWVGDVMLSLPAVRDLRKAYPASRIEVLGRQWVGELYQAVGEVDAVRASRGFLADVRSVRGAFDVAVLLPNSIGTALVAFAAGIRERWGFATDARGLLLTRPARVPASIRGRSQVYYYRAMLEAVGVPVDGPPQSAMACPPAWRERGRALLGSDGPWVGVNAGAFYGTAKRWLPERFAAAADAVAERLGARVALVGAPGERELGAAVASAMKTPARNLCGETALCDLVGVLAELRLLLTNDSGPMHVAAALGTPLVAVFGSTDWRETAPVSEQARIVREDVACAPCLLRECPIDHRCMERVQVDAVVSASLSLLGVS